MNIRPRRLRKNQLVRELVQETRVHPSMLVYPMFIREGHGIEEEVSSMPGVFRYSPDRLGRALEEVHGSGVRSVLLFGLPEHKDELGSSAWHENGVVQQALRAGRSAVPELVYMTDVCMCEYTSHGHCGALDGECVDNDATLELLSRTALSHVAAGADVVAPSDMMDGRVCAIRDTLDKNGFSDALIFSYAVKYASGFYGPFREAAESAPSFGDRRGYQMDSHNVREALRELELDIAEGADMVMVKPGLPYLDVVSAVAQASPVPVGVYFVSGEYAMTKAAAMKGWIDERRVVCESAVCARRAGADILVTYYARELAGWMKEGLL